MKDEPKSLIGALVSERTPDKKVTRKIITKTRANLTETEPFVVPSHPVQVLYCYCHSPVSKNMIGLLLPSQSGFTPSAWVLASYKNIGHAQLRQYDETVPYGRKDILM